MSVQEAKIIDFIYWSGLIFCLLVFVVQLQHWTLAFLASRKVAFAVEIWKEARARFVREMLALKRRSPEMAERANEQHIESLVRDVEAYWDKMEEQNRHTRRKA